MNLASRMRPTTLSEFVGQSKLVGSGGLIQKIVDTGSIFSMIFWGPPGTGKTTLAKLIAKSVNADFYELSGVTSGKEDLRNVIDRAREQTLFQKRTILFIDEIHRWNKAQQDGLLPHVESGLITLIGATTENPSFEVISALLSRTRVFVLESLSSDDLKKIIKRALKDKVNGFGSKKIKLDGAAQDALIRFSGGDGRVLLNALEIAAGTSQGSVITKEIISDVFQNKSQSLYDKKGEEHYNIISAFIKSMRGSDPDGALYYLVRMLDGGEDPKFIARRMIIFASEDIGLADRGALIQANAGFEAVQKIGLPECALILAHIVIYLAKATKSRMAASALMAAQKALQDHPNAPVPLHLRNAPTKLMKSLGYAKDYKWSSDFVGPSDASLSFLPEVLKGSKFVKE